MACSPPGSSGLGKKAEDRNATRSVRKKPSTPWPSPPPRWDMSAVEGLMRGVSGAATGRDEVIAGDGEEGAGGWRAGGGLPHEKDAAVQGWVGEAEPDQPGGAFQPGRGQHREADLLGCQFDHHAKIAGLGDDAGN